MIGKLASPSLILVVNQRPGAPDVELEEELQRVIPVIEAIRSEHNVWISIDTSKAEVMKQAALAGADIINDVRALQEPGALEVAATLGLPILYYAYARATSHNAAKSDL